MDGADRGTLAQEAPADLQETGSVSRDDRGDACLLDRLQLLVEHRGRDLRVFHRESAAEAAAGVATLRLDELEAAHAGEESARLFARTFHRVFPRVFILRPPGTGELILIGSRDPLPIERLLEARGVDPSGLVPVAGRRTTLKTRIIAHHQQVLRADEETREPLPASAQSALWERVEREIASAAAAAHLAAGMTGLRTEHYVGAHWLATFATLALTEPDASRLLNSSHDQ